METPAKNKGGRPEGSANRMAREAREAAKATGMLPHEILLSMARGHPQAVYEMDSKTGEIVRKGYVDLTLEDRKDAAKAAAPYFAPKISTVEVISGVQDDDLDAIIKSLATQAGFDLGPGGEGTQDESEEGARKAPRARVKLVD